MARTEMTTSRVATDDVRPTASPGMFPRSIPRGYSRSPVSPTWNSATAAGARPGGPFTDVWGDEMNRDYRVLIVEDEPNVRLVFRTALEVVRRPCRPGTPPRTPSVKALSASHSAPS
jgi:hypothetical protein